MIDLLTPRPLGSTAFTLLICVGGAAVLGRLLVQFRYLAPIVAGLPLLGRECIAVSRGLRRTARAHRGSGSRSRLVLPGALYNAVIAAIVGPAGRPHGGAPPGSRAVGLVIGPLEKRLAAQRRPMRFMAFGVAVIIGITVLTGRLAYMQLVNGGQYLQHTDQKTIVAGGRAVDARTDLRPFGPPPGHERAELRRQDPARRPRRVEAGSRRHPPVGPAGHEPTDINTAIDSNPGSRFDLVRIANDVPEPTARLISEESADLPGVRWSWSHTAQYPAGTLFSQILGYTGPVSAGPDQGPTKKGYLPDDWIGKAGVESSYERYLRGTYGSRTSSTIHRADAPGALDSQGPEGRLLAAARRSTRASRSSRSRRSSGASTPPISRAACSSS